MSWISGINPAMGRHAGRTARDCRVYHILNVGLAFWLLALVAWSLSSMLIAGLSGGLASVFLLLHGAQWQVFNMFGKNKTPVVIPENRIITAPDIPTEKELPAGEKHNNTVIATDVCFEGNITTAGQVYIYGEVLGNIDARDGLIKVMRHGRVQGNITSRELIIDGTVQGECQSEVIDIHDYGHVEGTLAYFTLSVKKGGGFTGRAEKRNAPESELKVATIHTTSIVAMVKDEFTGIKDAGAG